VTYKIVVATDLTDEALEALQAEADIDVTMVAPRLRAVQEALADAHALIARDDVPVDKALLDAAPNLKVVGRVGAGLSGIDIPAASARGIVVTNTPGTSAVAAAEHTLALMLGLSRRLVALHDSLKEGYWLLDRKRQAGNQLSGKTLGIIGLGRVGRVVAERCLAFGMTVLAFDPYLADEQVEDPRIQLVGLGELLTRSDVVTLHLPSTSETRGIVDESFIRRMKPGAKLINTAFGGVMDEAAAAAAVKDGHLSGVGIDVYAEEPPYNSPLVGIENVLHTPHVAENTVEAAQDLSIQIIGQVVDSLRGSDYRNAVNMPFLPGTEYETVRPYLTLAERMGTLLHVLSRHPVRRVAVDYRGDELIRLVKPLTVALLKGLLARSLGESVSYVNAPMLAAERGIQVAQTKGLKTGDYSTLVSVQVTLDDGEEIIIAGTLLDRQEAHIVQINEYRMNFVPSGHLVIMGSFDQPGVIGKVGTLMAENKVNIASWHTGRATPGGQTLTVLTLDQPLEEDVFAQLLQLEFVRHAHQVAL
jgi:D-3-phosphoglycerate dehydrogenase / 2-oxoglutarate reductase